MRNRILAFKWDNGKGEDWNGQYLITGQHLPNQQNDDATLLSLYTHPP